MNRIDKLKTMLKAREGRPGYEENVKAIKAEIERLEQRDSE